MELFASPMACSLASHITALETDLPVSQRSDWGDPKSIEKYLPTPMPPPHFDIAGGAFSYDPPASQLARKNAAKEAAKKEKEAAGKASKGAKQT